MKNPKIVVTDNRREYYRKINERIWKGITWGETKQEIEWIKLEYNE